MSQSKGMSLVEALVGTAVGLVVSVGATAAISAAYNMDITLTQNLILTFWMTVVSVLRSYLLRRAFNHNWKRVLIRALDFYERYGRGARKW